MLNVGDKCYRIMCSKFIVTSHYRQCDDIFLNDTLFEKPDDAKRRLMEIYESQGKNYSKACMRIIERD